MQKIIQQSVSDLTVSAHAIKAILGIKLTRAGQRHASAMGYSSANHLIAAVKESAVERDFNQYLEILTTEIFANHQITITDELAARLRLELTAAKSA